jgi:membrane-associated phospholipid phosphatase
MGRVEIAPVAGRRDLEAFVALPYELHGHDPCFTPPLRRDVRAQLDPARNACSAWGTAFPSSHVAAALVAAGCAWRALRPLGMTLVPLALLMSLATVYGQFHYAVDALAGAALAAVVLFAGRRAGYDAGSQVSDPILAHGALR